MKSLTPSDHEVYGVDDFELHHEFDETVRLAYQVWRATQAPLPPTREEIERQDPDWISDMLVLRRVDDWLNRKENNIGGTGESLVK